jgi:hypothetical protein
MELELIPSIRDLTRIGEIWKSVEERNDASFFLSWGWIENWISSLPDYARPVLYVFKKGGEPHLAFFLGRADVVRKNIFKSRGLFLNATGIPSFDRVYIEYNGFLCRHPGDFNLVDIINRLPLPWDEFYLPGLDGRSYPGRLIIDAALPYRVIVDDDLESPYVDLEGVRAQAGDYLSLLSANTRSQINRSYRLCEKTARIRLEVAGSIESALDIYREMVNLHEATWAGRNQQGAFCSDYLFEFHKQLILRRFAAGDIQLLRVKSGNETIGCLYNYLYRGHVYFYQSGINYDLDKRLKPGLIVHVEAIRYNAAAGHMIYDFLGGGTRYKMSLATHHNRLIWVRLQKPLLKFRIESALRKFKHILEGMRGRFARIPSEP